MQEELKEVCVRMGMHVHVHMVCVCVYACVVCVL